MKLRTKLTVLLLALLVLLGAANVALAERAGDFEYRIENGEAIITGYTRNVRVVTIPSTLGGYPVTTIGNRAFSGRSGLTEITFPDSVTTIGDYAFSGCRSLTSITLPDSELTIGKGAFYYCSSLTMISIPKSVTSIGMDAFSGCSSLTIVNSNAQAALDYNWGSGVQVCRFEGDFSYGISGGQASTCSARHST